MKVYVVTKGEYSDYHICCVCLDKETAERRARLFDSIYTSDKAQVEEFDTDEYQEFTKNEDGEIVRTDGKKRYDVRIGEYVDGGKRYESIEKVHECEINEYEIDVSIYAWNHWFDRPCGVPIRGIMWVCGVYARDEKEALRIAYDMIAKKKWEMVERSEDNG